jgi:hypothetical protein
MSSVKGNLKLSLLVFESPVAWTEKKPATEPDPTAVRSVSQLLQQRLWTGPVASCIVFEIIIDRVKTGCNRLQLVFYSVESKYTKGSVM